MCKVHYIVVILFILTLASDRAVLIGNDVFSILVVSINVLKTLKTFTDCHIKTFGFKMKTLRNAFWNVKTNTTSSFAVKVTQGRREK